MAKLSAITLALSLPATVGYAIANVASADTAMSDTTASTLTVTTTTTVTSPYWHQRFKQVKHRLALARRRVHGLKRTLMSRSRVRSAISLACVVYGSCSTLRRRAWCESRYDARATNASGAAGLFQFLPSTWRSTPFGFFSIFDPYANSLAAGWMQSHGRGGEWSCR